MLSKYKKSRFAFFILIALCFFNGKFARADTVTALGNEVTMSSRGAGSVADRTYIETITLTNSGSLALKDINVTFKKVTGTVTLRGAQYDDNGDPSYRIYPDIGILLPGKSTEVQILWYDTVDRPKYTPELRSKKLQTTELTSIQVKGFFYSGNVDDPAGSPVGVNSAIYIDGFRRGLTAVNGTASVLVASDESDIQIVTLSGVGSEKIEFIGGYPQPANVIINSDRVFSQSLELRLEGIRHEVLAKDTESLNFSLFNERNTTGVQAMSPVVIESLNLVELLDEDGNSLGELTNSCTIKKPTVTGSRKPDVVQCTDRVAIQSIFSDAKGRVTLNVAIDGEKSGTTSFYLGDKTLIGTLLPSPSKPNLKLSGIPLSLKINDTSLVFKSTTDANGEFIFPNIPSGMVTVGAVSLEDGKYYYGDAQFYNDGTGGFELQMKSADDFVPSATASPDRKATKVSKILGPQANAEGSEEGDNFIIVRQAAGDDGSHSIGQTLIPKGTQALTLRFSTGLLLGLREGLKGAWNFQLFGGSSGEKLFSLARSVREQVSSFPVLVNNSPGEGRSDALGEKVVDVSALTKNGPIVIKAVINAVGATSGLMQSVVVDPQGAGSNYVLNIDSAKPEDGWKKISGAKAEDYFSVPLGGKSNVFQRNFDLKITKNPTVIITRVKAEALFSGGEVLLSDSGSSLNFSMVNEDTLRVRSTLEKLYSSISPNQIPESNYLSFRFTLEGKGPDGKILISTFTAKGFHVLWPLQGKWDRFGGARDKGGDDWADARTLIWLNAYKDQMPAINDISGEHSRDLGHASHGRGTDIDIYHFLPLPAQGASGTAAYFGILRCIASLNYLDSKVEAEKKVADDCKLKVVQWINVSRSGIDRLAALPNVESVLYIDSGPLQETSQGKLVGSVVPIKGALWGAKLLRTGKITLIDSSSGKATDKEIDLGTGEWNNVKYRPYSGHYHHVHLTLKFPQ